MKYVYYEYLVKTIKIESVDALIENLEYTS